MVPLRLTAYEQSALAELAQRASAVHWQYFGKKEEATEDQLAAFADTVLRYDKIKWGEVYDKLHRTGENS